LDLATRSTVNNVILSHDGADFTLGARNAIKEIVGIVVARRALNEDILHGEETFTTRRTVGVDSSTNLGVVSGGDRVVKLSGGSG
jgi:hypothetical protein